jgi:hypothetical protein
MSEWSSWFVVEEAAAVVLLEDYGIYQVRIVDHLENRARPIPRLVAVDTSGLCYIGRSGFCTSGNRRTIANRMREWSAIWHPGAALYYKAKPMLGNHRIEVRGLILPDERIVTTESQELIDYRDRYGELPPFNSVDPGRWD